MVPLFRSMQARIDTVNRVLREQLTGIRVVRAFVREDVEIAAVREANEEVTDTALRAGRLFALMFPIVMLVLNVSSVAVIWFGAFRIEDGSLQIGTLIAFLQYLIQILMAVMMATFMAVLIPRAAVSADRIGEVLDTESTVTSAASPVTRSRDARNRRAAWTRASPTRAPSSRCCSDVELPRARRASTTAIIGSTGAGKTTLVNLHPAPVRRDRRARARRRRRRARTRPRPALVAHRARAAEALPVLGHRREQPALRQARRDGRRALGSALDVAQARDFVEAMPERPERPDRAGRHQRLGRPAAAARDRAGARQTPGDLRLRRLVLGARHQRRTRACARRSKREVTGATIIIVAQRVSTIMDADQILVLEDGRIVGRGTHEELLETSETYAEIV